MSLSIDGVWKVGVWAQTVWADGVWSEGAVAAPPASTDTRSAGSGRFGFDRSWLYERYERAKQQREANQNDWVLPFIAALMEEES